jgi:hypothetical protein
MGVEGLGDLAGEPEVVVGGEVGVVDEFEGVVDGRGGGGFHDGGGFIEFVKHGDVEAGGAVLEAGAGLGPEELAIESGDGVEGFVLAAHGGEVAPTEAGEDDGEKGFLVLGAPGEVAGLEGGDVFFGLGRVLVASDGPGADDIGEFEDIEAGGVGGGIAAAVTPVGGNAGEGGHAAEFGVAVEEAEELGGVFKGVAAVVAEADAPDGDEGFALMVEVMGVFVDAEGVAEVFPVLHDVGEDVALVEAGEVEHEGPGAAGLAGGGADVFEDAVGVGAALGAFEHGAEALEEDAVDLVLLHPFEVAEDGARVGGAEDLGGGAVGVFQGGVVAFFGGEFGDVGPEVDVGAVGFVEAVVGPVEFGTVVRGVEPKLRSWRQLIGLSIGCSTLPAPWTAA